MKYETRSARLRHLANQLIALAPEDKRDEARNLCDLIISEYERKRKHILIYPDPFYLEYAYRRSADGGLADWLRSGDRMGGWI